MNRRDFIKTLPLLLAAPFFRFERIDFERTDMDFKDLLLKIAQNKPLKPHELDQLGQYGAETQQRNSFLAGNIDKITEKLPFYPIYSEVLETSKLQIDIDIPPDVKHLIIIGAGATDSESGADTLALRFNDDDGENYSGQTMQRADTTQSGFMSLNQTKLITGTFLDAVEGTGDNASFFAIIPYPNSNYKKTVMVLTNYLNSSYRYAIMRTGFWDSTEQVQKISFFSLGGNNILKGSVISIYGFR